MIEASGTAFRRAAVWAIRSRPIRARPAHQRSARDGVAPVFGPLAGQASTCVRGGRRMGLFAPTVVSTPKPRRTSRTIRDLRPVDIIPVSVRESGRRDRERLDRRTQRRRLTARIWRGPCAVALQMRPAHRHGTGLYRTSGRAGRLQASETCPRASDGSGIHADRRHPALVRPRRPASSAGIRGAVTSHGGGNDQDDGAIDAARFARAWTRI